jgi:hypothetical protein
MLMILVATNGCSLLAVDGPPPVQARAGTDFVCTTSYALPIVDAVGGGAVAVHELGDVGKPDSEWTGLSMTPDHRHLLAGALVLTLFVSAAVGKMRTDACRDAMAEKERQRAASPPPGAATSPR